MAALLALAVFFAWSPLDHGAAASVVHAPPDAHCLATNAEAHSFHRTHGADLDIDCLDPTIACCGMAHCQPGLSSVSDEMPFAVADAETAAAATSPRSGGGPKVIPPPPRRTPV